MDSNLGRGLLYRLFCLWLLAAASSAAAETIYESGTLGPTGVPWSDLFAQTVEGTNISPVTFNGVKFHLDKPVLTTQVGGHFVWNDMVDEIGSSRTFFGAIVKLDDQNDFPDSINLSTPDVLGNATLSFPTPSAEVFGNLSLSLQPGWYALTFGSGLFGTRGFGGAVRNGTDIGEPAYINAQVGQPWYDLTLFPNHRFVITGQIVPEPSSLALTLVGLVLGLIAWARRS